MGLHDSEVMHTAPAEIIQPKQKEQYRATQREKSISRYRDQNH